ncbi:MAG: hypothetical protein ACYTBJ_06690 [Planctomycetota bacterium]
MVYQSHSHKRRCKNDCSGISDRGCGIVHREIISGSRIYGVHYIERADTESIIKTTLDQDISILIGNEAQSDTGCIDTVGNRDAAPDQTDLDNFILAAG